MARHKAPDSEIQADRSDELLSAFADSAESTGLGGEQDLAFRPELLSDFVGQGELKKSLHVAIEAAKGRGELPDHMIFQGPPGLGKTTLAAIVAHEMGAVFRQTSAPALAKAGDLLGLLTSVEENMVVFIDEIHRLHPQVSELLHTAMEDFAVDVSYGDGLNAKSVRIELPHFTLIGATTRPGAISKPLLDRFGIIGYLRYYEPMEILSILRRDTGHFGLTADEGALTALSTRARGTPRIAKRLLRRVRDWATVEFEKQEVSVEVVDSCLSHLGVDERGLDRQDRRYLEYLVKGVRGRPVGVETISAALSEDVVTLETVVEPYLLQSGLIIRTPRGRIPTEEGALWMKNTRLAAA